MATTREKLRAAALDLFADKGFRGTTIGDIEAAVGLAPRAGSFYRHYASKDEVFADCIETFADWVFTELSLLNLSPLGDVRAELLVIGRTILDLGRKQKKLRVLLRTEGPRHQGLAAKVEAINRRFSDGNLVPWLLETLDGRDPGTGSLESLAFLPLQFSQFYNHQSLPLT